MIRRYSKPMQMPKLLLVWIQVLVEVLLEEVVLLLQVVKVVQHL